MFFKETWTLIANKLIHTHTHTHTPTLTHTHTHILQCKLNTGFLIGWEGGDIGLFNFFFVGLKTLGIYIKY